MTSMRLVLHKCWVGMQPMISWKGYMITVVTTLAFVNVVLALFGNTIPHTILIIFGDTIPGVFATIYRMALGGVILGAVVVFAMVWLLRARPHHRPSSYAVVIFDVYGQRTVIDGLRTLFKNHDVAWSYMKQYKASYPLHNFALVSSAHEEKPTIYRYI